MRAAILALGFVLLATGNAAAQLALRYPAPGSETAHLRLPQSAVLPYSRDSIADDADNSARNSRTARFEASSPTFVSVGSFKVGMDNDGPRKHFARIELEDTHILGGNISGTFDGRGGALHLSWPTGN